MSDVGEQTADGLPRVKFAFGTSQNAKFFVNDAEREFDGVDAIERQATNLGGRVAQR